MSTDLTETMPKALPLNWIKKNMFKNNYMNFFTAKQNGQFYVADEYLISAWKKVDDRIFKHVQSATWKTLDKEFHVYDNKLAKRCIFRRDNETVTRSNIYIYHFNAALVMRTAYIYRSYSGCTMNGAWRKAREIERLLVFHQYDEAKAILMPEMMQMLKLPASGPAMKTEAMNILDWCAEMNAA